MIPKNAHELVIKQAPTAAGTTTKEFTVHSSSAIVSVFVRSISGTLSVKVYSYGDVAAERKLVMDFPELTSSTTELLLRKSSLTLNKLLVVCEYSDACDFTVLARAVEASEQAGANNAIATNITVGATPVKIIPSSLTNRAGLIIRNYSDNKTLFIGFLPSEATTSNGFPLEYLESLPIDVRAGVDIWAVSSAGDIDVRIMQAGN